MRVATWNVNGIRARHAQLEDWIATDRPDVICLQEVKAQQAQVPEFPALEGYWTQWHCGGPYSGVALHLSRQTFLTPPRYFHPPLDYEHRIAAADVNGMVLASIYIPNGGKDFPAKMRFLEGLASWMREITSTGDGFVLAGDMNVTRTDQDVHPKERKPGVIGQRPDERELFERVIAANLTDVGRTLHPNADDMFTWWAPWRNMRQRNMGWRLDYVLATEALASRASACTVQRDVGTSDHAPVVATFDV